MLFGDYTLTLVSFASHLQTSIHQAEEICPVVVPAAKKDVHETLSVKRHDWLINHA